MLSTLYSCYSPVYTTSGYDFFCCFDSFVDFSLYVRIVFIKC